MSLADLHLPREELKAYPLGEVDSTILTLLRAANQRVHEKLAIPDPEDQEGMVSSIQELPVEVGGREIKPRHKIVMALTVGENEYPDYEGQEALLPTDEALQETADSLLELAREQDFGDLNVTRVEVHTWENTCFVLRSPKRQEWELLPGELKEKFRGKVMEPTLRFVVSPARLQKGMSSYAPGEVVIGPREINIKKEEGKYRTAIGEMVKQVEFEQGELLGETMITPVALDIPHYANTDIQVELDYDLDNQDGSVRAEEIKAFNAFWAQYLEYLLNQFNITCQSVDPLEFVPEGENPPEDAEVWVRERSGCRIFTAELEK